MTTMEDLTKTQIVLLTLLVSFITSIATGIITTSLLAQAPQNVTQTIDRVVEHTIEQVAPTQTSGGTVREVTVVKEDDAIVSSISQASPSIVRIKNPTDVSGVQSFYGLGVVVDKTGLILTDKRQVNQNGVYSVVFPDNSTLPAIIVKVSTSGSLVLMKLQTDDAHLKNLKPVVISKSDPQLGQTIIAVEGRDRNTIGVGRVVSLGTDTGTATTDLSSSTEEAGTPLLDLSGELIGMKTSNADLTLPPSVYTVASPLAKFVSS